MKPSVFAHHTQGLSDELKEALKLILKLPPGLQGAAYEKALQAERCGVKVESYRAYSQKVISQQDNEKIPRDLKEKISFIYLDQEQDRDENDFSATERLAATDPVEKVSYLQQVLNDSAEAAIEIFCSGTEAIGKKLKFKRGIVDRRRAQQIRKANLKKQVDARNYINGAQGQGALFGFDGEELA